MAEDYFLCLDWSLHIYQGRFSDSITSDLYIIHIKKLTPLNSYIFCKVHMTMLHKEVWSCRGCFEYIFQCAVVCVELLIRN
jgi:hypothetical protein